MLDGLHRTLIVALVAGSLSFAGSTAEAGAHHHHRRYWRPYGYYGGPGAVFAPAPGFSPAVGLGFGHYPVSVGFSWYRGPGDPRGSLKTIVYPRRTEVFIDGYYVGVVDDFDGSLQGLRLDPGPHRVTLYLEGYRLHEETIYSTEGSTVKLRQEMEPLAPGEPPPPRPSAPGALAASPSPPATPPPLPPPPAPAPAAAAVTSSDYGTLALRSSPPDADVWIDGERWVFPPDTDRFVLHLPAGTYQLELGKEGYEGYVVEVEIQPGETSALNVILRRSR